MIEGVTIRDLIVRIDERGSLTELLSENMGDEDLCHVYVAMARPGVVKAWHSHMLQKDRFVCIKGTAKIGLLDLRGPVRDDEIGVGRNTAEWKYIAGEWGDRQHRDGDFDFLWPCDREWYDALGGVSPTYGTYDSVILECDHPQMLTIPAGICHGQMAVEGRSVILNAPSRSFDRAHPDELRIPHDAFDHLGFSWPIQNK